MTTVTETEENLLKMASLTAVMDLWKSKNRSILVLPEPVDFVCYMYNA